MCSVYGSIAQGIRTGLRMSIFSLVCLVPRGVAAGDGECAAWGVVDDVAPVSGGMDEVSGLAASHRFRGVTWAHNDAGDEALLYAIGSAGEDRGRWAVDGAENVDWEDIALGPCPEGATGTSGQPACSCLFVGDVGDNDRVRGGGVVYVVPEPDLDASPKGGVVPVAIGAWFVFPDGSHDTESLLVGGTGEVVLVTKESPAGVYRFPTAPLEAAPAQAPVTLEKLGTLWLPDASLPTGADLSPGGLRVAIRSASGLWELSGGGGLEGLLLDGLATSLPAPPSDGGEAVTWAPDGRSLWLVDEGTAPALWSLECVDFAPETDDTGDALITCQNAGGCGCTTGGANPAEVAVALVALVLAVVRRRS